MKFKYKIFILCIIIYITTLTITGIVVTQNNYNALLNKEITRSLKEQNNVYSNTALYLLVNEKQNQESINIMNYTHRIVDMFEDEKSYVQIFNSNCTLVAPDNQKFNINRKQEIESAVYGKRNYVLRRIEKAHYLFINQGMNINNQKYVLSYIKDITEIDEQKRQEYKFFIEIGIVGLVFIAVIIAFVSKFLMKPIEDLSKASQSIAAGNYKNRVKVKGKDEVSVLAAHYNIMAEEIEEKITQLQEESQRKQRFIDNLAHELRTPLTSIIGYSELLMKIKYDEATFQKGLGYVYSEGTRMLRLVNMLMKMILVREDPLEIKNQNIMPIFEEVKDITMIKAQNKKINICIQESNIYLDVDKDMIKSVLINLVDNAIKASKEKDKIVIGACQDEDKKYIFVQDEGKGINKEELNKISDPFYRVDKARSRKEGGVGLGLSLCREIVKRHNAKFIMESEVNEGTIVKIIF